MSRGGIKITRADSYEHDSSDRVNWLDSFAQKLAEKEAPKTAVEQARARNNEASLVDQINAIMGGPPRYSSVAHAVSDMQERTGLAEYLRRVTSSTEEQNKKTAQGQLPESLLKFSPDIQSNIISYLNNRIHTHRGQVPVPAIQEDLLSTFKRQGLQPQDVNNDDVARFISNLIMEEQKNQPNSDVNNVNLGRGVGVTDMNDDDGSNTDFFKGLLAVNNT